MTIGGVVLKSIWFKKIIRKIKSKIGNIKWFISHGYRGVEAWDFCGWAGQEIPKRLKGLKELKTCTPKNLSIEEFNVIIDKMIWAFENFDKTPYLACSDEEYNGENYNSIESRYNARVQEGLFLFAYYFGALWE